MVGFSFRILSSQHRLISSHLNKSKLSSCRWRVSKRIQILFRFNVDGCFLKGRVANWVAKQFFLSTPPSAQPRLFTTQRDQLLRLNSTSAVDRNIPSEAGLRLVPNPDLKKKKQKKHTIRVSDGELIVCFRTCL